MDEAKAGRARAGKRMSPAATRWRVLIAGWSRSGQTQRAYCLRMGVSFGTFTWWKHQLTGTTSGHIPAKRRASASPRFVRVEVLPSRGLLPSQMPEVKSTQVAVTPRQPGSVPLEIIFPGDIRVRVGLDCDGDLLRRVLVVLRGAGC
jgi:hypothetical protein